MTAPVATLAARREPGVANATSAVVPVDRKVQFLRNPCGYLEHPIRVDVIETHYSWVFLTETHAYKLKKPVQGDGFDFRSVEARRRNALAECGLNRRLAGDIYLAIVPLMQGVGGRLGLGGLGTPVDWLVKMRRLDAGRMFDRRLACHDWRHGQIQALAHHLAGFFATAHPALLSMPQFAVRIERELAATRQAVSASHEPALFDGVQAVTRRLQWFMKRQNPLFRQRIHDRRFVDGHGDLRPEHVYLDGRPRVIDCLEFRTDLRQLDPVSELAYLALECRRLGGPRILDVLLRGYRQRTGDKPSPGLAHFYIALNAVIRTRIAIRHLNEPGARSPEDWVRRAGEYLAIAAGECRFLSR